MFHGYTYSCFSLKRNSPGDHFVQDNTQRIDIRAVINLFPLRLFGRHVIRGSDQHTCFCESLNLKGTGYPKIHDMGISLFVDHDVLGL